MYDPIHDGMQSTAEAVCYADARPPEHLSSLVHCYWELKTVYPLAADFQLHALPDACVNLLFNLLDTRIAGVTALHTRFELLNLGKAFHYAGVQLFPGVWRGDPQELSDRFVGIPYGGPLPLVSVNHRLAGLDFQAQQAVMTTLVEELQAGGLVVANPVTESILRQLDSIRTVADMAAAAGLSPRQLQRVIRQTTGFAPHDLLKVLRLQGSFRRHYLDLYADQSHYIHSFRKVAGYTPTRYAQRYGAAGTMSDLHNTKT